MAMSNKNEKNGCKMNNADVKLKSWCGSMPYNSNLDTQNAVLVEQTCLLVCDTAMLKSLKESLNAQND